MLRTLLLAAVLVPLAGCPAPAQVEPGDGPVIGPQIPTGPAAEPSPDLEAARQRWAAAGLDAYTLTLERICFCPSPDFTGPFDVTVRNGAIDTVELNGATVDDERGMSVAALFELIDDAYAQGAEQVTVAFDAELGYPTRVSIDYSTMMADEEIGYTVSALRAADR